MNLPNGQKRALAVHDISGVGRCSLTVALPIIAAAGAECSVLPTAVLSTHTGGFTGYTCRDLTADIVPMIRHWKSLNLRFDAIYTGYLGSFDQIELMKGLIRDMAAADTLVLVDPVMGDDGKLYAAFNATFPPAMKELCAVAGVITPNVTEACFLLGREYAPGPYSRDYMAELLNELARAIPGPSIVMTGAQPADAPDRLGAAVYDAATGGIEYILGDAVPGRFHGTGDVFGSAVVGAMLAGKNLAAAVRVAVDFTVAAIKRSAAAGTEIRYGVNFEAGLPGYMKDLGLFG